MTASRRARGDELANEELIERLRDAKERGDSESASALQDELARRNVGLVKSIAARFLGSGEPLDDLVQAGYIGLLNAVANFDLARNTRFSTYATHLIQGEIRHYIRDKYSTIRIPQWVQAMNRRLKQAEDGFFQEVGRPPTLIELAGRLDITPDQLTALLRGRESMTYISIDQERRNSDPNPAPPVYETLFTADGDLPFDVRMRILVAIEQLEEMQRRIVEGLFYQGKSQSEVGEELGISQRQVSRLKDRTLREMRHTLGGEAARGTGN